MLGVLTGRLSQIDPKTVQRDRRATHNHRPPRAANPQADEPPLGLSQQFTNKLIIALSTPRRQPHLQAFQASKSEGITVVFIEYFALMLIKLYLNV
jgi:hypothetical protein